MRKNLWIRTTAAGAMLLATSTFGQVIRIQKDATVDAHQDVRLGDLAQVTGTDAKTAESLTNLVVFPDIREGRSIRAEAVLMAVISQIGPGSVADHLQVSGSATCDITLGGAAGNTKTKLPIAPAQPTPIITAMALPANYSASAAAPVVKEKQPGTLAQLVIAEVQQDLGVGADDLRVSFTVANPLLDQVTPEGKKWVFRPMTRTFLGTVQFEAQLFDGNRVVQKCNLQLQVLKRQQVYTAAVPLSRGDVISKEQLRATELWIDRQMPTWFQNEKDVLGLEAVRAIDAGSTLDQRDFAPVAMAQRGEAVSVYFIHGNLKIQMKGVAMQGGKYHDSISVKNESTNELYQATLIAKHLAVVGETLDEKQEKQLRESR